MKIELERGVIEDAIVLFGSDRQIDMAIEECSELMDALMKYRRGRVNAEAVITEIADVQIMTAQLELIFGGNSNVVEMERKRKIDRLRHRIEKYKGSLQGGQRK